ncbi:MAG: NAD(P)/FAD-dependent oxidoreductase [Puniceicoccaceae bacterium]|nr:MAG: NAD(P)/FAD-dependent oxidoreductase [Puniceicoccaceae bacterium]
MAKDWLEGIEDSYDVVVIGSGLAGLTSANTLAKCGHSVLLLEHHYQFGGLATWFKRKGGHIFDISLHGFPVGMVKSCRKYWTKEIADSIVQLQGVRFINPQFDITTTFDREDFTRILQEEFRISAETVERFFSHLRAMNFYDNDPRTTADLFEEFFPGRDDVTRLLMEPIAYANGSTMQDPAITYGIVFSNFMSKGVFTFRGGTDLLIKKMIAEMKANGVEMRRCALVERILLEEGEDGRRRVCGVVANGREIRCRAILSNANLKSTVLNLAGEAGLPSAYVDEVKAVRLNTSSCQVYIGLKPGETFPHIGDLIFTSEAEHFSSEELIDLHTRSRTFSIYYPDIRPGTGRHTVVCSLNARYEDWNRLSEEDYQTEKKRIIDETLVALERYLPGIQAKIDHVEAATPRTIEHYTRHLGGTSFGTKFEGLKCSMDLPLQIPGLYHAGSVGIIMSGWLGSMNYGVIVSNKIDQQVAEEKRGGVGAAVSSR